MIACETVSYTGVNDPEKFRRFHKVLNDLFPLVFEKLEITEIEGNLLLHWAGRSAERPLLSVAMAQLSPQLGAMVSTTVAFTMQSGSENYNSIPGVATLGANVRFIPHQGMDESLRILESIASKYKISMEVIEAENYSKIADTKCRAYRMMNETVKKPSPGS